VHLQVDRLAVPAALAERLYHLLERLARLVDRHETVRPAAAQARRLRADRRADQTRRL
jgi:hypothetical protein